MAKTKEEQKGKYSIGQVATQTEQVIVDGEGGNYTLTEFLVKLGNDIEEIKKSLIQ